eukprot:10129221-Karenia_brevis.AAC.1
MNSSQALRSFVETVEWEGNDEQWIDTAMSIFALNDIKNLKQLGKVPYANIEYHPGTSSGMKAYIEELSKQHHLQFSDCGAGATAPGTGTAESSSSIGYQLQEALLCMMGKPTKQLEQ